MVAETFRTVLFLLLLAALLATGPGAAAEPSGGRHLVIGKVTDNPRKIYPRLKAVGDYAASRLSDVGIVGAKVRLARDNQEMVQLLRDGEVDWVTESVLSAIDFHERAGAEIALRRRKEGVAEYRTVFVVRRDSGIDALADLRGRRLVLEDPGSTTACRIPLAILRGNGIETVRLPDRHAPVPPDKVGFLFGGSEINISTWTQKGIAAAGAYSDLDWRDPQQTPVAVRSELKVLHESEPFPRGVELLRADLEPQIRQRLIDELLRAHETPAGRKALYLYKQTERFDAVDETVLTQIRRTRELVAKKR